jgi:hypothetical protein
MWSLWQRRLAWCPCKPAIQVWLSKGETRMFLAMVLTVIAPREDADRVKVLRTLYLERRRWGGFETFLLLISPGALQSPTLAWLSNRSIILPDMARSICSWRNATNQAKPEMHVATWNKTACNCGHRNMTVSVTRTRQCECKRANNGAVLLWLWLDYGAAPVPCCFRLCTWKPKNHGLDPMKIWAIEESDAPSKRI